MNPGFSLPKTYTILQLFDLEWGSLYRHGVRIGRKNRIRISPDRVLLESLAVALQQEFASRYD